MMIRDSGLLFLVTCTFSCHRNYSNFWIRLAIDFNIILRSPRGSMTIEVTSWLNRNPATFTLKVKTAAFDTLIENVAECILYATLR